MSTTTTETQAGKWYTLKQFQNVLKLRSVRLSARSIRRLVKTGYIKAQKDPLRPKFWLVSHTELLRIVSFVSQTD